MQWINALIRRLGKRAKKMHKMLVQMHGRETVSRKCTLNAFAMERKRLMMDHVRMIERAGHILAQDWQVMLRLTIQELGISKNSIKIVVRQNLDKHRICSLSRTQS
ncbi:hypothetical protein Trydic_g15323 [Trypoxylus dichotomus]